LPYSAQIEPSAVVVSESMPEALDGPVANTDDLSVVAMGEFPCV